MNKPTFFRVLSIVLLVAHLTCLLPPRAALCSQLGPQHRLQEFVNNSSPPLSPIIGHFTDREALYAVSLQYAFGHTEGVASDTESKPWYKKWWVIGLGAAVVTGTVLLIAGGGDDDEPVPDQPLPDFPDPPAPAFR
jgi:hypothetical protein